MREISAGIIIYRRTLKGPKFLLLYHGNNYWNFPKGKIENAKSAPPHSFRSRSGNANPKAGQAHYGAGAPMPIGRETSWQAAVREAREETGLRLRDLKFRRQFKTYDKYFFYREKEKVFKIVVLYLAETHCLDIRLSKEHEGYGWFTYHEALKILSKYKDSRNILTQAYNFLRQSRQPEMKSLRE
jgi:8-oxo-dGTP pyrophosphatase MutT (NUDIX family)